MSNGLHGFNAALERIPVRVYPTGEPKNVGAIAVRDVGPYGIGPYDTITYTYTGAATVPTTEVYSLAGKTVATLTYTYDGSSRVATVVRS